MFALSRAGCFPCPFRLAFPSGYHTWRLAEDRAIGFGDTHQVAARRTIPKRIDAHGKLLARDQGRTGHRKCCAKRNNGHASAERAHELLKLPSVLETNPSQKLYVRIVAAGRTDRGMRVPGSIMSGRRPGHGDIANTACKPPHTGYPSIRLLCPKTISTARGKGQSRAQPAGFPVTPTSTRSCTGFTYSTKSA
jgi:hypothetical protein